MATTSARWPLLLAPFVLAACQLVPAPYQIDLYQTQWTIDSIGAQPIGDSRIEFNPGGVDGIVHVITPCGTTDLGVSQDSDGNILEFGGPSRLAQSTCSTDQAVREAELIEALVDTDSWSIQDTNHITFQGSSDMRLSR